MAECFGGHKKKLHYREDWEEKLKTIGYYKENKNMVPPDDTFPIQMWIPYLHYL